MNNVYNFSFLPSPQNPRLEWVGQSYSLSYLNSEPGQSYIFAYKPFELLRTRIEQELKMAKTTNRQAESRQSNFSDRDNQEGRKTEPTKEIKTSTKDITESLVHRDMQGILDISLTLIHQVLKIADGTEKESVWEKDKPFDRPNLHQGFEDLPYLTGYRPDVVKYLIELVYEYAINANTPRKAIDRFVTFAKEKHVIEEAIPLIELLFGQLEDFKGISQGHYVISSKDFSINTSVIAKNSIMSELALLPTINASDIAYITAIDFPSVGFYLPGIKNSEDTHSLGHNDMLTYITSSRPEFEAYDQTGLINSSTYETLGHSYMDQLKNFERPTKEGLLNIKLLSGDEESLEGSIVHSIIVDQAYDREGLVVSGLISETDINNTVQETFEGFLYHRHLFADQFEDYAVVRRDVTLSDTYIHKEIVKSYPTLSDYGRDSEATMIRTVDSVERLPDSAYINEKISYVGGFDTRGYINKEVTSVVGNWNTNAYINNSHLYTDRFGSSSLIYDIQMMNTERLEKDSGFYNDIIQVTSSGWDSLIEQKYVLVDYDQYVRKDAYITHQIVRTESSSLSARFDLQDIVKMDKRPNNSDIFENRQIGVYKIPLNARSEYIDFIRVHKIPNSARPNYVSTFWDKLPKNAIELKHLIKEIEKVKMESWIIYVLTQLTRIEKASMIKGHWEMLKKVSKNFMDVDDFVKSKFSELREKQISPQPMSTFDGMIVNEVTGTSKNEKEVDIVTLTLAERTDLDSFLIELMGGAKRTEYLESVLQGRLENGYRDPAKDSESPDLSFGERPDPTGIKQLSVPVGNRDEIQGLIEEVINAHNEDKTTRPAVTGKYILAQDPSEWEDIWERYKPGKDVIDVPNVDFDYEKLAPQVYDENGVPYKPKGPINKPSVLVGTPLHHPIPSHYDLGTEEVIVDNYIIIDTILAIHTIMQNNKLKFAGMPAERSMRELFSSLFAWIQGASPGNLEYDRMFRFARWYAEMIVLKLSDHILHRTYDRWQSTLHLGQDLGLSYTEVNFAYSPFAQAMQSSDTYSTLSFKKESFVDGEFTMRGFFDNPHNEGIMEVYLNGELLDTISSRGVFNKTYEIPQGKNLYEFVFRGDSGRVSISSMEITGCVFVEAFTTSDDTNTNGLKAATLLLEQLTAYYDLHHGDGKSKGTMEIKQRKLFHWQ